MKDQLDPQSRLYLINYKLDKAAQTLLEADLLAGSNFYNAAVNRLYYSAYYAASALMLNKSLETFTHKGVKMMLGLRYVQTGQLDRRYGRIYQRLFDSRQAGDYEDFVCYDKETYDELRPLSEEFIKAVQVLLHQKPE